MTSEDDIINMLASRSKGFIGDDSALLPRCQSGTLCVTKDLLVEDVHFRRSYFTPADLAHKALHANLSDLAASSAAPLYILCGIGIPRDAQEYGVDFLHHLTSLCEENGVILIGGDTVASPSSLFISITAIGSTTCSKCRKLAEIGDQIFVAGHLGWAHLGLTALELRADVSSSYIEACLRPQAKVREGIWLGSQNTVTSMIDLSDGLYKDLQRVVLASNRGAMINAEGLHISDEFARACSIVGIDPLNAILAGGEDYALLFTARSHNSELLAKQFEKEFGYALQRIGFITQGAGIAFSEPVRQFATFEHFK